MNELHLPRAALLDRLASLPAQPRDEGRVVLVVVRTDVGERATPPRAELTREHGLVGDRWSKREHPVLDSQVTMMRADVAAVFANGQPLSLPGDNLLVGLDISAANLPTGSRVRVGTALLEVTAKPHRGCDKFTDRFGEDACSITKDPELADARWRGLHLRVIEEGHVAPGDAVVVLSREARASTGVSGPE
jgi:MOSC domain-containing protein YiiM